MKTIQDLTPEIKSRIPLWKEKATKHLYNGDEYTNWKREDTIKYVEYCYSLAKQEKPVVIIANNIQEYRMFYNLLIKNDNKITNKIEKLFKNQSIDNNTLNFEKQMLEIISKDPDKYDKNCESHYIFLMAEYSRVYLMWYKFIQDEFKIDHGKKEELDWLYDNINKANIAKGAFYDSVALILRMPSKIIRNEVGFHCTTYDGAIQYPNMKMHYINGREIPDWVFDKYFQGTLVREDFINESNEDIKAGIITLIKENEGNEGLLKFLKAELIDEETLVHKSGHMEVIKLYKTKEKYSFLNDHLGNRNVPYAWFYEKCPSTGQEYLLDSSAALTTALEAAKFHRPQHVPSDFDYNFTQFNN